MSAATKKPPAGGVGRVSHTESNSSTSPSPSRSNSRSTTPTSNGHTRTRSLRTTAPVSARAAIARRDTLSAAESDARAEAAAAVEDLQKRLENEEKSSLQYKRQVEVLQSKLDEAVKESAKLEEKAHEYEEQIETLSNEKREMTRQMREMESIYEAERSSILKEKEEMASREEEMQAMIQRLKDSLAQRNNTAEESRPSRQHSAGSSPSLENGSFAPPSSIQRSDSRNSSKLILQKDKLIESLRLELAEAQIKLVESENQGGGRLHEVERLLMEARMANARLMEDNESYQLLLQERTLKGDFGQNDFSYMGSNSNQDALAALEGKAAGSSLADELSEATEGESVSDGDRRLEAELKSMKEQNKALTLYINKIIERLLQHQDFESILDQSSDLKSLPDTNKELPPAPADKQQSGATILQRAKSMAENQEAVKENKRASWYSPFTWGAKKEDQQVPSGNPIPE
ncbi:uncharacterized protein Y057_2356 [Fusarium fujikuroi]|nr:uncharacterized protein Y057_2356 [Fusarium fujikuroi]